MLFNVCMVYLIINNELNFFLCLCIIFTVINSNIYLFFLSFKHALLSIVPVSCISFLVNLSN